MTRPPVIHGPKCVQCQHATIWLSVHLVQAQPMNVFLCNNCEKLTASAAETIAALIA